MSHALSETIEARREYASGERRGGKFNLAHHLAELRPILRRGFRVTGQAGGGFVAYNERTGQRLTTDTPGTRGLDELRDALGALSRNDCIDRARLSRQKSEALSLRGDREAAALELVIAGTYINRAHLMDRA